MQINGKYVIKSGTDFRNFSEVTLTFLDDGRFDVNVKEVVVDSSYPEDPEVKSIVDRYTGLCDDTSIVVCRCFIINFRR